MSEFNNHSIPRHLDVYSQALAFTKAATQSPPPPPLPLETFQEEVSTAIQEEILLKNIMTIKNMLHELLFEADKRLDEILFDKRVLCTYTDDISCLPCAL